jgi:RNA polymerase sigma-70 factor (ECF subfamily)
VAEATAGDRRAFERLYRRHVDRVHTLAARMMSRDEAPEVVQDVFVRAWQKLGTFRGEAQFGTWLHRLAVNVILTRRAGYARQRERFIDDEIAFENTPSPPSQREHRIDFERAIAQLPPGARAVLVLHDVEGWRHEEIAQHLSVTTGTTKAQLHRARLLMRRALDA